MATKAQRSDGDEASRLRWGLRPDDELVAAAIRGNQLAFDDLVSRYRQTAVRVAAGIVGANQAEDVAQDAILIAYQSLASLKDRAKFSRWLMAITRWRAVRVGRKERRHVVGRVALDERTLETLSRLATSPRQGDARHGLLLAALETIPPGYAEVIRYHFIHRLPHQEIAEFLDVSLATVKWRCFRGKERLRCILSPEPACARACRKGCPRFPAE